MEILNSTGALGITINYITYNITGSSSLTYILILILLVALMSMFKLPVELIVVLILPMSIVFSIADSTFIPILGAIIILLAVIIGKRFLSN